MQIRSVIAVFCVLFWSKGVKAEVDYEVKRGAYSFMAFVYYSDETVVDSSGARFLRSAVLIKPQWLLSGAIDHPVVDSGFPRKTLLVRAGAIAIDTNFTLNEDEDEQEQEVIQIVRPTNHNVEEWWLTDITLLKTLLPFNITSAVSVASINPKSEYGEKSCLILFYAKRNPNRTEDKFLMQMSVELLPAKFENCGNQFNSTRMTCGQDAEDSKNSIYDPMFCQGNSGGPLLCESEVMGLQTYIQNNCKAPHLYQLLKSWESLISCGVQEKCSVDYCTSICSATFKDDPTDGDTTKYPVITSVPSSPSVEPMETTTETTISSTDTTIEETEITTIVFESSTEVASALPPSSVEITTSTESTTTTTTTEQTTVMWPKEKPKEEKFLDEEPSPQTRKAAVAAQQHRVAVKTKTRSAAEKNSYIIQSLLFLLVLVCVI